MRLLITGDAAGGVGTHARALAHGLARGGHQVTLAILGPRARAGTDLPGVDQVAAPLPLEWESERPVAELAAAARATRRWMLELAIPKRFDLLHTNHFALVGAIAGVPTLLGVHSDVISWWRWVKQRPPAAADFFAWYRGIVLGGLRKAAAVVAPSCAVLRDLRRSYGWTAPAEVIPNGVEIPPPPSKSGPMLAVTAGRLWDEGKQIALLARRDLAMEVRVAGDMRGQPPPRVPRLRFLGCLDRATLSRELAAAHIYIAPSRYEPFGLAPLEAAAAGCALLLNDLPSLREVWGEAALYFARNNGQAMSLALRRLADEPVLRAQLAAASYARAGTLYRAETMSAAYGALYRRLRAA